MRYPTISVITPTFNSSKTIEKALASIRKQNYPQDKIEILIIDGGSSDATKDIVKQFNVRIVDVDPKKQNVELNKTIGVKKAKGELLLMLDHDNIFPNRYLLSKMVKPFIEIPDMVGVETLHYHYDKKITLLDRYFALFGVTDPIAYYLGKADRMSYLTDSYSKIYNPRDCGDYYLVHFVPGKIPTIGANGFLIKRKTLIENADIRQGKFFHIDVNVDLIKKGFDTYAFVKGSVLHIAGHGNIVYYLKRRMFFLKQYYLNENNMSIQKARRYSVYGKEDFWKLVLFIVISATFIIPLIESIRGYRKIHDKAWFIHPILCFGFLVMYGYVILDHRLRIVARKSF